MVILMNGPVLGCDHSVRVEVPGQHRVVMSFPSWEVVILYEKDANPDLDFDRKPHSVISWKISSETSSCEFRQTMEISIEYLPTGNTIAR